MIRDSRLFLGLHPSMIADVLTDDQNLFKRSDLVIWSSCRKSERDNLTD